MQMPFIEKIIVFNVHGVEMTRNSGVVHSLDWFQTLNMKLWLIFQWINSSTFCVFIIQREGNLIHLGDNTVQSPPEATIDSKGILKSPLPREKGKRNSRSEARVNYYVSMLIPLNTYPGLIMLAEQLKQITNGLYTKWDNWTSLLTASENTH